jgi:hypothetical protein
VLRNQQKRWWTWGDSAPCLQSTPADVFEEEPSCAQSVTLWPDTLLSANALPLAKRYKTDELHLPQHLRLYGI